MVTDREERARHLAIATEADEDVARLLEEGATLARARGRGGRRRDYWSKPGP